MKYKISIKILLVIFLFSSHIQSQTWTEYVSGITNGQNASDRLGTSVAIWGDYAIIGSPFNDYDENGANYLENAGAVYILKYDSNTSSWTQFQKIVASDRATGDYFGNSVAFNGFYILIGAQGFSNYGKAYFFDFDNVNQKWTQYQKIEQDAPTAGDNFGCSVSMTATHAVIGVSFKSINDGVREYQDAGAVYIYVFNSGTGLWEKQQMIVASDKSFVSEFGHSVSIYGNYIVVGSPGADNGGNSYVFYGNPSPPIGQPVWTEMQIIKASDYEVDDHFGSSVSIYDDYFVVGDYSEDEDVAGGNTLSSAGSAYIFRYDSKNDVWSQRQKITASQRALADYFGTSVAIYDNYILVGAIGEDEDANNANIMANPGSVYFFKYNSTSATWVQNQKIVASNREDNSDFGRAVALTVNNIIIGSPKKDGVFSATDVGSSYLYYDLDALPVELTTFTASIMEQKVQLNWQTATEVNNYGFDVETLRATSDEWETIGFVEGHGNSNSAKDYSFIDNSVQSGVCSYRLKQIDFDGKYEYSDVVKVELELPQEYKLSQNYPNPFNPSTTISFALPKTGFVTLKVYDILGKEVATLVNESKPAGNYKVEFNASNLSSGVYFYKLESGNFKQIKKLMLIK